MERHERPGKEGSDPIDQLKASVVGGTDGGPLSRTGVGNIFFIQAFSVTAHVTISGRVNRYKLILRGRQAATGENVVDGGLQPMAWGCHVDM